RPIAVETSPEAPLIDPVTGEDLGVPLLGVVDLIQDDEYGPRICDFKTAAKSATPFEITHEIQLSSYAYLFRQATGRDEGGLEIRSLIKTKTPKIQFHHYAASTVRGQGGQQPPCPPDSVDFPLSPAKLTPTPGMEI
ncbi:MAG: PD-(D/E)XK nuclease family protein, partial [Planctomycetota bacterium]|nr:PD-(D/E)XK nuclease family protein [Planctomycetota bacterium]